MNFELLEQSIQYTFLNSAYGEDGTNSRTLRNVKKGATATGLAQVGGAIADLQGDVLGAATLIQRHAVPLTVEE
ncbi:DUF1659 domain-containing protein [Lactobacillus sp. XV13L]|nr:DUF1659 domain-containing protein [Lactobacillus sp. XV13L]